jgi:predicted ATPase with chaperone activity
MSFVGVSGGELVPGPGEAPRAHHGMLVLDELRECRHHVLEVLR